MTPEAVRQRRKRAHAKGDHQFCLPERCGEAAKAKVVQMPGGRGPVETPPAVHALVRAYRAKLEEADIVDTPKGAHVLALAEIIAAGGQSGSSLAALSKELRAAFDDALSGTVGTEDELDRLRRRREEKAAGA